MRTIFALLAKDLRRTVAAPSGLLVSLAIPLAISGTMALAFGNLGGGDGPAVPRLELVMVDEDKGPLSNWLMGAAQNDQVAKHLLTVRAETRGEGLELMQEQGHHAMLVIPRGFSEDVLDSRAVVLELIKNPARSVMPIVAQQGMEVVGLYGSVGARILPEGAAARAKDLFEGEGWDDTVGIAAMITDTYIRVKRSESLLFPPIIKVSKNEKDVPEEEDAAGGFDFLTWMYPGMMVMALLFVGLNQMKSLLVEQSDGTMRRLLAGPVSPAQLLVSKILASSVAVAGAVLLLLAIGTAAFGFSWGGLLPLAATVVAMVFAVTGFSAVLYSVVRTQNQGDALGGILVIFMSMLGGTMVPLQVLPDFLKQVSRFTLNYWGNEAFRTLAGGGGWSALSAHLPILAGLALAFTALGTALLRQRHLRGTV